MVVLGGQAFLMSEVPLYLEKTAAVDHTVGIYPRSYGGPRGVGVSYERGTPVGHLERTAAVAAASTYV
jgi:hypothetical protein